MKHSKSTIILLLLLLLWGCNSHHPHQTTVRQTHTRGFPLTIVDSSGHRLTLPSLPDRIVSCAPSITEILYKLGLGKRLVLDSTSCDFPVEAKNKPHFNALSGDIEPILAQNPDLIIVIKNLNGRIIAPLEKARAPVLSVDVSNLKSVYQSIISIGKATGKEALARQLAGSLQERIAAVHAAISHGKSPPSVLILYGTNPIYTTGPNSYINDLLNSAGGRNVVNSPLLGDIISPEAVVVKQPQIIICPAEVVESVKNMPGWAKNVPAVRFNRFYTSDTELERPGPRMADAVEKLARFLHPVSMRRYKPPFNTR